MTSTTSWVKPSKSQKGAFYSLYRTGLKRHLLTSAIMAVLLFLAMPLVFILIGANSYTLDAEEVANTAKICGVALYTPIIMLFSIIIGVQIFSYMRNKRAADMYLALPVKRTSLLISDYLAGLTLLYIPIIINYFLTLLITVTYGGVGSVMLDLLKVLLMTAACFAAVMFASVVTGAAFDMVASILMICGGYPLVVFLFVGISLSSLPGAAIGLNSIPPIVYSLFSPFMSFPVSLLPADEIGFDQMNQLIFYGWWVVFLVGAVALSVLLFVKRKSETAEQPYAYKFPYYVTRILVTTVAGLLLGLIFSVMEANFYLGAAIGSIVTHIIITVITNRGGKGLARSFIGYACFVLIFCLVFVSVSTGFFGFDTRRPAAEDVKSIALGGDNYWYDYRGGYSYNSISTGGSIYDLSGKELVRVQPTITSPEGIKAVTELHQAIISNVRNNHYPYIIPDSLDMASALTISYRLKDGTSMSRRYTDYDIARYDWYTIPESDRELIQKRLADVFSLEEYKKTSNMIFYLKPEEIGTEIYVSLDHYRVYDDDDAYDEFYYLDGYVTLSPAQLAELKAAVEQDILALSPSQVFRYSNSYYDETSPRFLSIQFNPRYSITDDRSQWKNGKRTFDPFSVVIPMDNTSKACAFLDKINIAEKLGYR